MLMSHSMFETLLSLIEALSSLEPLTSLTEALLSPLSLHDVALHGGPAPLLVGLVVLGLGLLAGEVVHQASTSLT